MTARRSLLATLAFVSLVMGFMVPALVNRSPILYPDTVGYYQAGEAALRSMGLLHDGAGIAAGGGHAPIRIATGDGVSTVRSVYYGGTFALAYALFGEWAIVIGQVLVCLAAILLTVRRAGPVDPPVGWAIALAVGMVAGAGAFAGTIMPDVFAGLMVLGIAMLVVHGPAMSRLERVWWLAVVLSAILFHKSHLLLACAVWAGTALYALLGHPGFRRPLALIAGMIALGGLGHVAVDYAVRARLGVDPVSPPFVLARMIGDRTAERYLRRECPHRRFEMCRFVGRMPMTENEFLWSHDPARGGYALLDAQGRRRVLDEERVIERGTVEAFGGRQLLASIGNAARQLGLVGFQEYGLPPLVAPASAPGIERLLRDYRASAIVRHEMPLRALSWIMALCYLASLVALGGLLVASRRRSPGDPAPAAFIPLANVVLMGVAANGVICGVISGVFDRYQGRVAWTTSLVALLWLNALLRARRAAARPAG